VFITGGAGSKLFPVLDGVSQVRRRAQEVDERASKVEQRLELAKPADRTELPLAARVLFRGHEQSQRFTAKWPRHTMPVRAEYTHPQEAKVTVEGDAERIGHIMFIVDCSLSMNERGKMTRAIDSLSRVLDELGNQANYAIGLRAYGRQSGFILPTDGGNDYQKDGNGNYLVRRLKPDGEYEVVSNDDPVGLHPDDDADDLLEPMALRKNQANAIRERIKDLRPNGVTPLYRALTNSLKTDFVGRNAVRDEGNTKHIVLITDGNDLFSKRKALGKTPTQTSAADVHSAWERSGSDVQVHIIFMDPPAQVAAELKEIPEKTGGIYKGANEAAALVQGIRQAIGLVEFSVDQPGSSNPDTPKYRLGETAKVTGLRQD
jgi:Mg-chelatase subunit ChlD